MIQMIKAIILFIISAIIFGAKCDLQACSPRFPNCMCRDTFNVSVFCKINDKLNTLPELFKDLHGSSIRYLKLKECTANSLQKNLFINESVTAIAFYCPFVKLDDDSLSDINLLEFLSMSFTKFHEIPPAITKLRKLMHLKLIDGKLITIGKELQNMTSLRGLTVKRNMIEKLEVSFTENLDFLDISGNRIKMLDPKLFQYCTKLKHFIASNNFLRTTEGLPRGDSIEMLLLHENMLQTVNFGRYEDVVSLDLSHNPLGHLPATTFSHKFSHLQRLDLSGCRLEILPSGLLETLLHLEYVNLGYNGILSIPSQFFQNLMRLKRVKLRNNKIEYLGDNIFKDCPNIVVVSLDENRLKTLGNSFKDASSLVKLSLNGNTLSVLREEDFKYFTSLLYLSVASNKITYLEKNVFQMMHKLTELYLDRNRISFLNDCLHNMRSLETIDLQFNKLEVLTENDMFGLVQLKVLHLEANRLKNIKGAFRMLNNLRYLNLRKNKLKTLTRTSFPQTKSFPEVELLSNKWVCDCRVLWLRELIIQANLTQIGNHVHCSKPIRFLGKKLVDLSVADLVLWPDGCPPSCTCSCVDEEGDLFVKVDCSSRNISEVPSVLPQRTRELILHDNDLTSLNLSINTLSNLNILDVERNSISSLNFKVPPSLMTMKLAGNKLVRFFDKPPSSVTLWTLAGNPWTCDCKTRTFRKWMLQQNNNISDLNEIRCENQSSREVLHNKAIKDILDSDLCPSMVSTIVISSVCVLILLLFGTSSCLIYSRYHYHIKVWLYSRGLTWLKKEEKDDHKKLYDVFISAADEELALVMSVLVPELEGKYPYYSVFIPNVDLFGGEKYGKEMEIATNSRRVVILLSKNYIKNNFLMETFRASLVKSLEEKKFRLILIIVGDLPPLSDIDQSLKAAIQSTRCLRFGQKLFWEMLRFAMPKTDAYSSEGTSEDVPLLQE